MRALAAAGLAVVLLLTGCGSDEPATEDAAPEASASLSASATPSPSVSPAPSASAVPGQPIDACPPAEEVAQALALEEVLPASDYAEVQKRTSTGGAQVGASADPGCAYGESQSLSFQVFDASGYGGGGFLIGGLRSNFDCVAGDCEVVADEESAYAVLFESDSAGRVLAATANGQYACGFSLLIDDADDAAAQARQAAERSADFLAGVCGA